MLSQLRQSPIFPAAILLALVVRLLTSGLSWVGIVALILSALWFAFTLVNLILARIEKKKADREPNLPEKNSKPQPEAIISLVYFLSDARTVDEDMIRSCIRNALEIPFSLSDPDDESFVTQFYPPENRKTTEAESSSHKIDHFMVRIPQGLFAVLVSDHPYIDNPREFARESIRDKRLRTAVEQHAAWLSVDLMDESVSPEKIREAYSVIGKILASMAGPDCLALYCPELQRCNEFDLGLLEVLSGDNPLSLFSEPTFEPVIEIADNDPRMEAAVAEAVSRWPEFVAAYEDCTAEEAEKFIVKAEFREGDNSEFMWVNVVEIEENLIRGILMNDPHELLDVHRGAEVEFSLDRLNDWIYPDEQGDHVGGFTLDVLADKADED